MIVLNYEQRSPEWFESRVGVITGSRVKNAMASNNLPFVDELIAEVMTGKQEMIRTTDDMQRGIDLEPLAKEEYEKYSNTKVTEYGLCLKDDYDWIGLSPDGLIEEDGKPVGAIEIKCPKSKTHINYIRTGGIPSAYKYQIHLYFLVVESLEWLDFMSFDPRVTQKPCHFVRVYREDIQAELDETLGKLEKFKEKWDKYYNQILF